MDRIAALQLFSIQVNPSPGPLGLGARSTHDCCHVLNEELLFKETRLLHLWPWLLRKFCGWDDMSVTAYDFPSLYLRIHFRETSQTIIVVLRWYWFSEICPLLRCHSMEKNKQDIILQFIQCQKCEFFAKCQNCLFCYVSD